MSFKNKVNQRRWYSWWHWGAVSQSWIKKKIQPVKGSAVRDLWLCCSSEWSTHHPVLQQLFRWCTGRNGFPQQTSLPIYTSDSNEGWKREQTMALLYSNSLSFHPVMGGVARSRDRWLERQEESLLWKQWCMADMLAAAENHTSGALHQCCCSCALHFPAQNLSVSCWWEGLCTCTSLQLGAAMGISCQHRHSWRMVGMLKNKDCASGSWWLWLKTQTWIYPSPIAGRKQLVCLYCLFP